MRIFPLAALSHVGQYSLTAIKHKFRALEEEASHEINLPTIVVDENNNSITNKSSFFWSNWKIIQMIECVESSLTSFFGFSYNAGVALLATIPALIRWNSQPVFPNVKTFWKNRVCIAGLSFVNSISALAVLAKITGLFRAMSSFICYWNPALHPTFNKINKIPDEDFQCSIAMALSGLVVYNLDQKSIIDELSELIALILNQLKPKIIEKTSQVNELFFANSIKLKDVSVSYDEKCRSILNELHKAEDLHGLKTVAFNLAKDVLVQATEVCYSKTTPVVKQAPLIAKHITQSIQNVVEETSPKISTYYQTGFSDVRKSLSVANTKEDVKLAVGNFCAVISQIFSGLATAIQYEKKRCMNEICRSLEESNQIEEEFFDAEDNQSWAREII